MEFEGRDPWLSSFPRKTLQWRLNGFSHHRHLDCLLNRFLRRRWMKTSKLRATGLCEGNSSVTGEFPTQRTSKEEHISIWSRHHGIRMTFRLPHFSYALIALKRTQELILVALCNSMASGRGICLGLRKPVSLKIWKISLAFIKI